MFSLVLNADGRGYERGGQILNSGALLAFMGVNLASFWQFYIRGRGGRQSAPRGEEKKRLLADAIMPLFGFVSCLAIWLSLPAMVKILGGGWLLAGLVIVAVKTRGFRTQTVMIDFSES